MNSYDVLLLGPPGGARAELGERLRRLGHAVTVAAGAPEPSQSGERRYDAVVVDARGPGAEWAPVRELGGPGWPPLLLVADQPRRLISTLSGREAGLVVLTGSESDGGFQVALSVCAAIGRPRGAPTAGISA
jgi:hypothetical protein